MKRIVPLGLLAAACLLVACSQDVQDTHPQKWVSRRQAIFKNFTRTLEPLGLVARERQPYDKAEFVAGAAALQGIASQPWPLFTADSNYPPTRAMVAVWEDAAGFKRAQDDFIASVNQLVAVAGSGDLPAIQGAENAVEKSCKSCHDHYRHAR